MRLQLRAGERKMSEQKMRERLEYLRDCSDREMRDGDTAREVASELLEALSQLEVQKPVAFSYTDAYGTHYTEDQNVILDSYGIESWQPLYAAPSPREAIVREAVEAERGKHLRPEHTVIGQLQRHHAHIAQTDNTGADREAILQEAPELTDDELRDLWAGHIVPVFGKQGINPIVFARAVIAADRAKRGAKCP
jgi:hypothetical protein